MFDASSPDSTLRTDNTDMADSDEPAGAPMLPWTVVALVVVAGAILRVVADSPLWLDEALSVHISQVSALEDALRQDGHPPLYYLILGWWIDLFGDGDRTVRVLSALFSLATLPFAYLQGRRIGDERLARIAVIVLASLPFAIRYANETRMYALATLLAFAGWWLFDNARKQPTVERLAAVAVVTCLLLYTHYWAMWLLGAVGFWLLLAAADKVTGFNRTAARRLVATLLVGGVPFLAWVPALLDQAANTGTPWAEPDRPTTDLVRLIFELGGGLRSEAQLLGMVMLGLVLVGLFGSRSAGELRFGRLAAAATEPAAVAGLALLLGGVMGFASGSVFQPRYFAVLLPFFVILLSLGLHNLRGRVFFIVFAAVVVVGFATSAVEARTKRSQGLEVALVLNEQAAAGDVVVWCPDQLGPSTSRYLTAPTTNWVFPTKAQPRRVNWRDYEERNRSADPVAFAAEALAFSTEGTTGSSENTVWLIMATTYRTYEGKCEGLLETFASQRRAELLVRGSSDVFEPATLYRFAP